MATTKATKTAIKAASATVKSAGNDTFAVIMTGGKQYKVRVGEIIKIEKIIPEAAAGKQPKEHAVGDKLVFDQVLLVDAAGTTSLGAPTVKGASVTAEITEIDREDKVLVVHYKQKSKYFKKYGHRQPFFKVKIIDIKA